MILAISQNVTIHHTINWDQLLIEAGTLAGLLAMVGHWLRGPMHTLFVAAVREVVTPKLDKLQVDLDKLQADLDAIVVEQHRQADQLGRARPTTTGRDASPGP